MPRFVNQSRHSRYGWVNDMETFLAQERIGVHHLIEAGANFSNNGYITINDDIIDRAFVERNIRNESQAQEVQVEQEVISVSPVVPVGGGSAYYREYQANRNWYSATSNDGDEENMALEIVDEGEDSDEDQEEDNRRVEATDFPLHSLPAWHSGEINEVLDKYFRQIEYRLKWIFYREEREGIRRRAILPFSPDDFKSKIEKAVKPHELNNAESTFYDWNLGSTDFIMRLERFLIENRECLRCHFLYKPNGMEIGYEDRIWNGSQYREVNIQWAESE